MLASELILLLRELVAKHGDLAVIGVDHSRREIGVYYSDDEYNSDADETGPAFVAEEGV